MLLSLSACAVPNPGNNTNMTVDTTPSGPPTTEGPSPPSPEPSLVAMSSGAYIVKRPSEWMDRESAYALLDENPDSFWATQRGTVSPQTIVIALAERTLLKSVEFDNS